MGGLSLISEPQSFRLEKQFSDDKFSVMQCQRTFVILAVL